jgi:hypothetical protein
MRVASRWLSRLRQALHSPPGLKTKRHGRDDQCPSGAASAPSQPATTHGCSSLMATRPVRRRPIRAGTRSGIGCWQPASRRRQLRAPRGPLRRQRGELGRHLDGYAFGRPRARGRGWCRRHVVGDHWIARPCREPTAGGPGLAEAGLRDASGQYRVSREAAVRATSVGTVASEAGVVLREVARVSFDGKGGSKLARLPWRRPEAARRSPPPSQPIPRAAPRCRVPLAAGEAQPEEPAGTRPDPWLRP